MTDAVRHIPITRLKGVGPAQSQKLEKLGIRTLQDLLLHLPHRFEDRTKITPIFDLKLDQGAVIEGEIMTSKIQFGRRRSLLVTLRDPSGQVGIRFFHFSKAQQKAINQLSKIRCFGIPRRGQSGLELYHPDYSDAAKATLASTLTPVYPVTEGVSQNLLRRLIQQTMTLPEIKAGLPTLIPHSPYPDLIPCIQHLHMPPKEADTEALTLGLDPRQRVLALEELTAHQIGLLSFKRQLSFRVAPALKPDEKRIHDFSAHLGFTLTGAQQRVIEEITADLSQNHPMLRLIQGDVGSGKTVVAAYAALIALSAGHQVAVMAPTEILAEQHLQTFTAWFAPLSIEPVLLTGKLNSPTRKTRLASLATGEAQLLIGTHALFQDEVQFRDLGLIIIDEQHRFGVNQRMALRDKGRRSDSTPHQLIMTATPIPRTLTMTVYASMDCSIIDELPPGRQKIQTNVVASTRRIEIMTRLEIACRDGAQAYWVCTLIETSETLRAQAAEVVLSELQERLPALKIAMVHGRMHQREKAEVMSDFQAGKIHILVATTVIEVGVDVPNASFMVIENAERLGLTQLHQLRGRVGRGQQESYCLLLYDPPLGKLSKQRLAVLRDSQDGFHIAEQDLAMRGPGDVLGERQSGDVVFKIADLRRDEDLVPKAHHLAQTLMASSERQAAAIIRRWVGAIEEYQEA